MSEKSTTMFAFAGFAPGRLARAAFAILALTVVASCQNGRGTVCSGEIVDTQWSDCGANQIEDQPRLYTGEAARLGPEIDVRKLNAEDARSFAAPFVGYSGTVKVNFAPRAGRIGADVEDIQNASPKNFNRNERVKVDLKDASIDFMLKQLLGGALGVNYIAPADLPGTVTFRTETPIPKSQLLEVVRDILARNGLSLRFFNGVFHVGAPELVSAISGIGQVGRQGELETTTIDLPGRQAGAVVELAVQIVPDTVRLLPSSDGRSIIMQASATDGPQAEALVRSLAGFQEEGSEVAIIPVKAAEPTVITGQISAFYQANFPELASMLTLIPLAEQQGIMVGVRENGMMDDVKNLIRQLDRSNGDTPKVRIIPLNHMKADEIAQQLATIFAGGVGGGGAPVTVTASANQRAGSGGGNGNQGGNDNGGDGFDVGFQPNLRTATPLVDNEDEQAGGDLKQPQLKITPKGGQSSSDRIDNEGAIDRVDSGFDAAQVGGGGGGGGAGGSGDGGGEAGPKIVPNTRSNSIMVFSTYEEYQQIKAVLEVLDVPQSQVVIEATIVEVDLTDRIEKGVQFFLEGDGFSARSSTSASPGDPGGGGGVFQAGGTIGNIRADVVLNALQAITRVKVISSPYLTVVNGKSARLVIGDQIPYAKRSQSSNNGGNVTVTQEVEVKDTGIILEVTPEIHANNSVSLKVKQQVSTPAESASSGDTTPIIKTRDVESEILVQSGRTILLGGLIQDRLERNENGVPVLRTIPAVGELFKQNNDRMRRVEMIVMITPRVVRTSSQIEDITNLLRSHMHTRPKAPVDYVVKP